MKFFFRSNGQDNNILSIKRREQYRTIDELFEKSRPNSIYYTLLILSAIIIAGGLLLNSPAIVIGGMLVTPVLHPLLVISLGLSIGEIEPIRQAGITMFKSILLIILGSLVLGFIFGGDASAYAFNNSLRVAGLYFIVAIAAGVAATFGWARKDIVSVLPGIAIAVSLVPPISLMGIGFSFFDLAMVSAYMYIAIFNFFGIIIGSTIAFSLLRFDRSRQEVKQKSAAEEA